MNWNHYIQDIKTYISKLKPNKTSFKEIDSIVSKFDNIAQNKLHTVLFDKIFQYFLQFFILILPLLPYENIYRCFRTLLQSDSPQNKVKKSYYLIKNVVQVCQNNVDLVEQKNQKYLKTILILVKKAAEKQFGAQIMNTYIEYYIERVKDIDKVKPITFTIVSSLLNILVMKYKFQTSQTIRNQIGNHPYFTNFLLVQAKHYPSFYLPFLQSYGKRLKFSKNLETDEVRQFLKKQFLQLLSEVIKQGLFEFIENECLFLIYPSNKNLTNFQSLLDEMILEIIIEKSIKVKEKIKNFKDWKEGFLRFLKRNEIKKIENTKLFVIICFLFSEDEIIPFPLFDLKNQFPIEIEVFEECINLIGIKKEKNILQNLKNMKQQIKLIEKERQYLYSQTQQEMREDQLFNFDEWKRILSFLFQQNINYIPKSQEQTDQIYPDLSYECFSFYNIKPKSLRLKERQKYSIKNIIFKTDPIFKNSLRLLQKIVKRKEDSFEQVSSQIKKLMAFYYEKVNETVIKSNIANIFFCKCLILTNNQIKTKIMFEAICRVKESNSKALIENLKMLLPSVHQSVLIDYANYLITKDKQKFRLQLFEKQLTQHDYLTQSNISDLMKPIYVQF